MHFQECRQHASPTSIILQVDFSENYRTTYQDEVQNAFFNYNQVGLFTAVAWYGLYFEVVGYALVSDDVSHDKCSVYVCLTRIITDLKNRFSSLDTVNIFSDASASQFKQRFSFGNLTFLSNGYNLNLIWNFFSSGYEHGVVNGIGDTVKRLV